MKFNSAMLLVSEDCNLRCKYCFEKKRPGKMSPEVMKRSLEFLCEGAIDSNAPGFSATFFGGEPTLNPEVCVQAMQQGVYLGKKYGKTFSCNMITNSVVLPEILRSGILSYGREANFGVQLSVDGLQQHQDAQRVFADGSGSWKFVRKTMDTWINTMSWNPKALSLHGCLTPETVGSLYRIWKYYRDEVGIGRLWFIPIPELDWKPEHAKIYDEQVEMIRADIMARVYMTKSSEEVDNYAPLDRCLRSPIRSGKPCSAGYGYGTITSTGDCYPCHQVYYNDPEHETKMGDIWHGIDADAERLFKEYDEADLGCAADCSAPHCYRCYAANWVYHGSMFSQMKGIYCLMMQSDAKHQRAMREELDKMGILNKKEVGENGRPYTGPFRPGFDSGDTCACNVNQPTEEEKKTPATSECREVPTKEQVDGEFSRALKYIITQNEAILGELRLLNAKK